MVVKSVHTNSYGVLQQTQSHSVVDDAVEMVRSLGYAVIDSGYTELEINEISEDFNRSRARYIEKHTEAKLRSFNEFHMMRLPLTHGGEYFLKLALNKNVLNTLKKLMSGQFILNQQNGVVNPSNENYAQGAWHRDLPYQHYVSTKPLAVNALFCVDDFTVENGSTLVLPASHKSEDFPSLSYIKKNALQVEAKAGSFILLDCMLFHSGGFNSTSTERRAVNHVYNIPYFKQQINIPANMTKVDTLSAEEKTILGFNYLEPVSIDEYFLTRQAKY
jgi:ectoine hydroxylase-related dioxygenase (phytanoyl-CoA dioxygenase family)